MNRPIHLVLLTLDHRRYALHLVAVERVVRVVEITSLPKAPEIVLGVINVQGRIVPVINIRRRFGLPERELKLNDQLIIARTSMRTVALVADSVSGVAEFPAKDIIPPEDIVPQTKYIAGIVKLEDGLVLIHDLDQFLSLDEERTLDASLNADG